MQKHRQSIYCQTIKQSAITSEKTRHSKLPDSNSNNLNRILHEDMRITKRANKFIECSNAETRISVADKWVSSWKIENNWPDIFSFWRVQRNREGIWE